MVARKREKMACRRSMAQKKEKERKTGVAMSEKKGMLKERERTNTLIPLFIYPSIHTLAPSDQDCMTCFSMDPLFDFTIYGIQVCLVLTLP